MRLPNLREIGGGSQAWDVFKAALPVASRSVAAWSWSSHCQRSRGRADVWVEEQVGLGGQPPVARRR